MHQQQDRALPFPATPGFNQQLGPSKFTFSTNDLALFVQDDWRVQPIFHGELGLALRDDELMPSPPDCEPGAPPQQQAFPATSRISDRA